jgi:hypothetical protein
MDDNQIKSLEVEKDLEKYNRTIKKDLEINELDKNMIYDNGMV